MKPIKFNDTSDYQHMEVLGVKGAFTSLRIQRDSLPEGFHKYSLRDGEDSFFGQVAKNVMVNHAGDFITKSPLELGPDGFKDLGEDDWTFTDEPFKFEEFFSGHKRSIDCQIADAEAKRDALAAGQKSKSQVKTNPLTHESH